MSETRTEYAVSGLSKGPNPRTLLHCSNTDYMPPTWEDVRSIFQEIDATGSELASFLDVSPRTVRKWLAPPTAANHAPIPFAAWHLILVALGKIPAPALASKTRSYHQPATEAYRA